MKKQNIILNKLFIDICFLMDIEPEFARMRNRLNINVIARQIYAYYSYNWEVYTLEEIASVIDCDHSTISHSVKKIADMKSINDKSYLFYLNLTKDLEFRS